MPRSRCLPAVGVVVALLSAFAVAPAATAAPALAPAVVVTEILGDTVGVDTFEYFEVHNTTDAPIDLAGGGVSFAYSYVDSDDRSRDVALAVTGPLVLEARETAVLWVSYTTSSLDSFARSVDEFRAYHAVPATTKVARVTGQAGIANGGDRGIRVLQDDEIVSWSHIPADGLGADLAAHFRLPADPADLGLDALSTDAPRSPGVVAAEALVRPTPDPGPEPDPAFDPQPDPSVVTTPLQVTELLPDSTNVGSADGFEFIEVYNATDAPIDFSDYSINYLYPDTDTSILWPATPKDAVVPSGETLVFWVKNGQNDELGAAEFNARFGTSLTLGENLIEIYSAGMANGSARGIEVVTNTGHSVSRALYNEGGADDVDADQGIRYEVSGDDLGVQALVDVVPATPGAVQSDQVPAGLMIVPADTVAPTIEDRTVDSIDPAADFPFAFAIGDDVDARTATLTLSNDVDGTPAVVNLLDGGDGVYTFLVPAVDLTGKSWFDYSVTVSDGTNETVLDTTRVGIEGADDSAVRLNVADGQFVAGETDIIAAGDEYPSDVQLSIDDQNVATRPSLESAPVFAFEVTGVNYYFKNGVLVGDDVLRIFQEPINDWTTLSTAVPLDYVVQGDELVVSVWAGTKKAPELDDEENNDNFQIRGLRLVLPDGRTLTPIGYDDPQQVLRMGDSGGVHGAPGNLDFYDARFALPDDAHSAVVAAWDTTGRADGPATIAATDGAASVSRTVTADNTAPTVASTIADGTAYQGEIVIDADVTDAGAGLASASATLDGAEITLPHTTSSVDLEAGEHVVEITAADALGNTATWSATFTTYEEQPSAGVLAPAEGAEVEAGDVTLQAKVEDPTGDVLDVAFLEGRRLDLSDGDVSTVSGTVNDALALDRDEPVTVSGDELATLAADDGLSAEVSSDAAFPYQLFDIDTADVGAGAQVRATWAGRANADATVILYALRADGSGWTEVTRHVATADDEQFTLVGVVDAAAHSRDGVVRMLVQHSEGFAGEDRSTRDTAVTPHNPGDVARSDYDFTFGWESDTQYYNENTLPGGPIKHQEAIHSYFLEQRDDLNLQYVFHTGDIVDDWDQEYQWQNASPEYDRLDAAGLPYGVLAGNHDVGGSLEDYAKYSEYFGDERFAGNPWFGGSYEDNRGHYDLLSAGGVDFIMVYQGWGPGDEEVAWMNEVLAQHPDRVAIIAQHEFILTTGGLGEIPQRILDEVVATNPNVKMVFSGHYHDALTRTDSFDDDGDGVDDRTVYSMLFDYQGLPEGGLGYLRLLHFDNEGERMMVRTYSPSLDDYNSDEATLLGPEDDLNMHQEFELTYDELGIEPGVRTLGTDAFTAEILSANEIASFDGVASGSILSATWPLAELGERGWYVRTSDPHGAVDSSSVSLFSVVAAVEPEPGEPGTEQPGTGAPGTGAPGTGGPDPDGAGEPGVDPDAGPGAAGDAADGEGSSEGDLATTGSDAADALPWAIGAVGLLLAGAFLLLARRRRLSID